MIEYPKLIALILVIAFMALLYLFAYDKGYEKHKAEVAKLATSIIVDSRQDILSAAKEVENAEKNIKHTLDCDAVLTFDLTQCVSK